MVEYLGNRSNGQTDNLLNGRLNQTLGRMNIWPETWSNGHFLFERTVDRTDTQPNRHLAEWTLDRIHT